MPARLHTNCKRILQVLACVSERRELLAVTNSSHARQGVPLLTGLQPGAQMAQPLQLAWERGGMGVKG